jgi:tetratricopeptide (TPR) repeat protein
MNRLMNRVATVAATCMTLAAVSPSTPAEARKRKQDAGSAAQPAAAPAAPAGAAQPQGEGGAPAAPPPVESSAPASKTLEHALKLYDSEDYYMSSIELDKVVDRKTGDDEANVQRAEFFMGKTLFNLKFYSASLSYFSKIVEKGSSHRYYQKTLQWLASLSRFLPESAGVLEKIGKYSVADLEQPALEPVRNELYYLLGRFHYTKGNFPQALELFGKIPLESEHYTKSQFLAGITHVRQYAAKDAAENFRNILRKAKDKPDKTTAEYEELANISLARVFYSTKQYQLSIKYYDKIPPESPDWLNSLFESSWARFQVDDDSRALGNIHTLNAPFFENEFFPESLILKAVVYFQKCDYDRALETLVEFNATYPSLREEIMAVIKKTPDNADFYKYVLKVRSGEAGLSDRVQRAVEGALQDRTLTKTLDYVAELDRELRQVDKADPNWKSTQIAGTVLQDLTLQKSIAENEAGNLARKRLERLATEIQNLIKDAIKVEYETLNGQKGVLEASIRGEQVQVSGKAKKANLITTDDEHLVWPFRGEYWKDELGYYRFKVVNKCEQGKGGIAPAASPAAPPAG